MMNRGNKHGHGGHMSGSSMGSKTGHTKPSFGGIRGTMGSSNRPHSSFDNHARSGHRSILDDAHNGKELFDRDKVFGSHYDDRNHSHNHHGSMHHNSMHHQHHHHHHPMGPGFDRYRDEAFRRRKRAAFRGSLHAKLYHPMRSSFGIMGLKMEDLYDIDGYQITIYHPIDAPVFNNWGDRVCITPLELRELMDDYIKRNRW